MKCFQTLVVSLLLHVASTSAYSSSQTNFCRTLYGKKSIAQVPTESVLTTRCTTTTTVIKMTPTTTVTPTPVTTTKNSTRRVTVTTRVTKAPKTATVTATATNTRSSTLTLTATVNVVTTVSSTTTSTSTIAPSAGFVPINPDGNLAKRNATVQRTPEEKALLRIEAAPSYARTVYCTRSVVRATSTVKTSTASAVTTIAKPKTSTVTQVVTATKTVTQMPPGVATTVTVTTTTDTTSYASTTVTASATATATQVVTIPELFYSACAATNQLDVLAGNAFFGSLAVTQMTLIVDNAYDCCVACMQTANCGISYLFTDGRTCGLLSDGTCRANNLDIGSYNLVKGDPSVTLSNGNCGSWDRFV